MNMPLYDALKSAGATDDVARAAACAVANGEDLATKEDVAELRGEINGVRGEVHQARLESKKEITELRGEVRESRMEAKKEIAETRVEIAEVRGEVRESRLEAEKANAETRALLGNSLAAVGWKVVFALIGGMTTLTAIFGILLAVLMG